ncbi:MAG: phospho-sugar mutase [Verrucomicrobia bacterium]|nr:phospho-sugar mutase [Verrucomicrobiota bacterium]MBU6446057.1 phospho-sugar mutase [Verrucomicrobiota bacterium]MDE3047201.1 phospho-sugar mutase [Verrucomicrobiota bacterium]
MPTSIHERIQSWLKGPYDPEMKAEIRRLLEVDPNSLQDAFFKDLSFGTGGMRGVMGIGTNRMNIYTIRRATQGLANTIRKQPGEGHRVFIGYDVRNHSREFAEEAARVLSGNNIEVLLSKDICPTPLVSFACRYFHCTAAIMITASHNPPQYNGYKVYWSDGCQVVPPHDAEIMKEVEQIKSPAQVVLGNAFEEVGSEIDDVYLEHLKQLQMLPAMASVPLHIVYSNLHGTGIRLVPKALKTWGYTHVHLVKEQQSLDGNFPNAPSPNPEEEKAMQLGMAQLMREKGDLFIATDPDADRIGLAVGKTRFNGNQIGCLCLHHICKTLRDKGEFPENGAFVKSIVTTELFRKIAESFGGKCIDVLTGFKYIGEQIGIWEKAFDSYQYLFGAEESYGYLFGTFVRDKDAVSAACLIAEMAASAKSQGKTLVDILHALYAEFGIHLQSLTSLSFPDSQAGMDETNALMRTLRTTPPQEIGGQAVVLREDFLPGLHHLPPSDVLRFWLKDQSKLVIRPSGTEPKVKIYAEAVGVERESEEQVDARLKALVESFKNGIGYGRK